MDDVDRINPPLAATRVLAILAKLKKDCQSYISPPGFGTYRPNRQADTITS